MKLAVILIIAAALLAAESSDIFERVRHVFPNAADGERAASELRAGKFGDVKRMLAQLSGGTPKQHAELLAVRGAIEFLNGEVNASAEDLANANSFAPLNDADNFTLAMALVKLGNEDHARVVLGSLEQKYPDRALYTYWLGRLDYDQRRYQEAVAKLSRATDLDPQAARAWDSLGLAHDMQGQFRPALAAFEKASELNRKESHPSPWPPHNLGYLLLRMNQPEAAAVALEESLHYDPSLAISNYHLGRALEKLGRNDQAITAYKRAIDGDATATDACYSLAMLYRKLQRAPEADEMFAEYRRRKSAAP